MTDWNPEVEEPPRSLELSSIPKLIEEIMEAEDNQPVICAAIGRRNESSNKQHKPDMDHHNHKLNQRDRTYIDVQCNLCKAYGHKQVNCDKMALYG